jgi:hypothetical protein
MYILPQAARATRRSRGGLGYVPVVSPGLYRGPTRPVRVGPAPVRTIAQPSDAPPPTYWGGNPPTTGPIYQPTQGNGYSTGQNWSSNGNGRKKRRGQTNVNTTGAPSTIESWDQYGNPVYSVPPPGVAITGRDAAGNPLYGASSGSQPAGLVQTSAITGVDAAGTPLYSSPPPGQVVVGTDNYGNPIYSGSAASATALQAATAAGATAAAPATTASGYQSILDWLSEETLISGFPNWGVVAGGGAVFLLIQAKMGGRR